MKEMYSGIPFSPQTALADSIGAADTIIKVSDITAFPDAPNYATIGTDETGETILYAAKTADALSGCTRGIEGTAKSWPAGSSIARNFTNKDFEALQENIRTNQTDVTDAKKAANDAATAAADAQKTANNALPTAGGTMSGALNMNGNQINGLNAPTQTDQPATKGYVDGQVEHFANVTVTASSFVAFTDTQLNGAGYGYRAAIGLSGVTSSMMPIVVLSEEQVESGLFGATADSNLGGVYLYAKRVPDAAVTIPLITLWHSGGPHGITNAGMKKPVVVNPNLLDNWYFVNPVNQRGQTSYDYNNQNHGYTIDRWMTWGKLTVNNGYITNTTNNRYHRIEQNVENGTRFNERILTFSAIVRGTAGKYVRAVLFDNSNNIYLNDNSYVNYMRLSGEWELFSCQLHMGTMADNGILSIFFYTSDDEVQAPLDIKACKLELGDTQTLAHQDAEGNWVLNEIPDYGEQLDRCQRCALSVFDSLSYTYIPGQAFSTTKASICVPIPVTMRTTPSLWYNNLSLTNAEGQSITVTSIRVLRTLNSCVILEVTVDSGLVAGNVTSLYSPNTTGFLFFSADL